MKLHAAVGLILSLALAGCSVQVSVNEKSETDMGSHHVVVKPGSTSTSSSSSSGGGTEIYQYSCGDVSVEIKNEELIVNSTRYGKIPSGVDILIDQGVVFIGGEKREGIPMTAQEVMGAAPVKETSKDLDGHAVTVRPGSSFTSTTQVLGKHTLTVGKTKVSIKNNELFVNGISFGGLTQGDTILVDQGTVSVSGQTRDTKK